MPFAPVLATLALVAPLSSGIAVPSATPPSAPAEVRSGSSAWKSAALFLGGSLTAFTLHESGHLTANLAFGCTPHLEQVSFAGVIPFFAITSDVTCRGDRCTYPVTGGTAPFGDLHGTHTMTGAPRHLVNTIVLGVAVLDLARYAFPDVQWLAWASRAAKLGLAGVTFTL